MRWSDRASRYIRFCRTRRATDLHIAASNSSRSPGGWVSLIHARVDSGTLAAVDKSHTQELAFRLLHGDRDRWQHVQAVAARADELRPAGPAAEGSWLCTAAWVRSIG